MLGSILKIIGVVGVVILIVAGLGLLSSFVTIWALNTLFLGKIAFFTAAIGTSVWEILAMWWFYIVFFGSRIAKIKTE